jgi:hypothetical protein
MHSQPVPSVEAQPPSAAKPSESGNPAPQPLTEPPVANEAAPCDVSVARTWKQRVAAVRDAMYFWVMSR